MEQRKAEATPSLPLFLSFLNFFSPLSDDARRAGWSMERKRRGVRKGVPSSSFSFFLSFFPFPTSPFLDEKIGSGKKSKDFTFSFFFSLFFWASFPLFLSLLGACAEPRYMTASGKEFFFFPHSLFFFSLFFFFFSGPFLSTVWSERGAVSLLPSSPFFPSLFVGLHCG